MNYILLKHLIVKNSYKGRKYLRLGKLLSSFLFTCIIVAACLTIYVVSTSPGERFTEFYVLDSSERADKYPTTLVLGESGTVVIGVVNHEYQEVTYRIVFTLDNELIGAIDSIILNHDGVWIENYTFTPEKVGKFKLEFLLFKEGLDEPCRDLFLWINVSQE